LTVIVPAPFAALAYTTVTVGLVAMLVSVPPEPDFVWTVNVAAPGDVGAVTPVYVRVNVSLLAHVWVTVIT
jgi:hypothetical protein